MRDICTINCIILGLLLSSPRCVRSIIEAFQKLSERSLLEKWKTLKCFTVGGTTARLVRDTLQFLPEGCSTGNMANLLQLVAQCKVYVV